MSQEAVNPSERYLADCEDAEAGKFTMDPARQRELLARLGLSDPQLGFLKLAQAAVQSGAGRMDWLPDPGGREVQFRFPLLQPPPQPLWTASGGALPLAVLALSQQYELNWRWQLNEVARAGSACGKDFQEEDVELFGGSQRLEITVRETRRRWFRSFTKSVRKLLADRLAWAGVLVGWGDEYLNRLVGGGKLDGNLWFTGQGSLSRTAEAFVLCEAGEPGDLWLPGISRSGTVLLRSSQGERLERTSGVRAAVHSDAGVYRGWAALGLSKASWSETHFVKDGVVLEKERNLLDRPGIVAYVSAAGLHTDLSGMGLVHDDLYRQRLMMLRPIVIELSQLAAE